MILRTVREAHGTRSANALVSGSGPRVLWTLGGGSKTLLAGSYPRQMPSAAYGAPALQVQQNRVRQDLLKGKNCVGRIRVSHQNAR